MFVLLNVFSIIYYEFYFKGLENGCIVRKKLFEKGYFFNKRFTKNDL